MPALAQPAPVVTEAKLDIDERRSSFDVASWEADSGLPQNTVRAILQARDGHIWAGMSESVARFNGTEFTVFSRQNTPGFPASPIVAMLEAPDGAIWIATDGGGVSRLQEGRITPYSLQNGLVSLRALALALGGDGSLWIGSAGGVTRLTDGRFTHFNETQGLVRDMVRSLHVARSGEILVGTSRGLNVIKHDTVTTDSSIEGLTSPDIRLLFEDAMGARWLVTPAEVVRQQQGTMTRYTEENGIVPRNVTSMLEDRSGVLWFGTNEGLFRFEHDKFVEEPLGNAAARFSIKTIREDREGNLWLGTGDGLKRVRRTAFNAIGVNEGLSHNEVVSVCRDLSGAHWVGTAAGLNRMLGRTRTVYTKKEGLLSDGIRALAPSRSGGVWVGFDRSGVVRIQEGKVTPYTSVEVFDGSMAQALFEDREGTLWIGTRKGLCSLREGKLVNHMKSGALAADAIRAFAEDAQGGLWIATNQGPARHKDGQFSMVAGPSGPAAENTRSLFMDRDGVLWIGTNDNGLSWMRDGELHSCTTEQGLFNNTILDLVDDESGHLWLVCRQGIFRIAKQELFDLGRGARARVNSVAFNKADGLLGVEGSGFAKPAAWRSADGSLAFATLKGMVTVDPSRIKRNETPPPVVITGVRVDGIGVPLSQLGRLPPGDGELEFSYAALSYTQPEKVRFKYKLEGVNENWVDAGARRVANYSRLPPGRHRFQVQAMNNDGVWNLTGDSIEFFLAPRFYQTWWFYTALAAFIGSGVYGAYSIRVRSMRKREQQLVALVQERTAHLELEISDRKRAEEALKGSEALYHSLVDVLPVNLYRKDKDGRFTFANNHFCAHLGRARSDIVGKTELEVFPEEVAAKHTARNRQVLQTQEPIQFEEVETSPNGEQRWRDCLKVPVFDGNGALAGTQGLSWDITARKRAEQEVARAQRELLEVSRLAGMAEVATGVLHNVGNVLNSVNVSATVVADRIRASKVSRIARVAELLREHGDDLANFLTTDDKGRAVPDYLAILAKQLTEDQASLIAELGDLRKNIEHIKHIVAMQQDFAKYSGVSEAIAITDVVEDALRVNGNALARHGIELERDYRVQPTLTVEKHKVMLILVNLIENAKHACNEARRADRKIVVRVTEENHFVHVAVVDNGIGIPAENLTRIFAHGFTTRDRGHGFGLHSSALAAKQLGGRLTVRSDGPGKGAEFVLELPLELRASARVA